MADMAHLQVFFQFILQHLLIVFYRPRFPPYVPPELSDHSSDSPPSRVHSTPYPQLETLPINDYDERERRQKKPRRTPSQKLILTSERLSHQTALARKLQNDSKDLFELLRTSHRKNQDMETELYRAREELKLYKYQFDMAQKEIDRAEQVVKVVEKARIEAEERSVRDRELTRKVIEEREVERAREEGKREGFNEGLEQGRRLMWRDTEIINRERERESIQSDMSERSRVSRLAH